LQLRVGGDLFDECVGALGQYRCGLQLDVVVQVDAQLLDEGPQDALEKAVDREYRKTRIVVQNARAGRAGAAADFGLVEPRLAPQQAHVSAPLPRRQRVDLLQDARLHLLGRLVGEGDRQNRAVTFGTFDDVVHVFVGQLVGFARSGAGVQYFRSHIRRVFSTKGTNFPANRRGKREFSYL